MICIATILIGFSVHLTKADLSVIDSTKAYCLRNYLEAPCLVRLEKKSETTFRATCGTKKNE